MTSTKNSLKWFFPPAKPSNKKRGKKSIAQETIEELSSESDTEQTPVIKRTHERKESDQSWFKIYPWLDQQVIDGKITLFCSLFKERKEKNIFDIGKTK